MKFRVKPHSDPLGNRTGMQVVEVFDNDGRFLAMFAEQPALLGSSDHGLKFISKHLIGVAEDPGLPVPALVIELAGSHDRRSPYVNDAEEKAMEAAMMNLRRVMHADPNRKLGILTRRTVFELEGKELTVEDVLKMKDREVFEVVENPLPKAPSSDQGAQVRTTEGTIDEEIPGP